jgi:uncharacterized membrane protein
VTAAAVRAYEQAHEKPSSRRWQVLIALILGAILLGAGVLLFVAAHWDGVSPVARMLLVLTMLWFLLARAQDKCGFGFSCGLPFAPYST